MTLTPEERQRIYEEEKARREANDRINSEKGRKRAFGCLGLIVGGFGILIVLTLIGSLLPSSGDKSEQSQSQPTPPVDAAQQDADIKALMAAGLMTSIDGDASTPRLMVGQSFYALDYEQRKAFAKKVSDWWATKRGAPGGGVKFEICDDHTGEKLYTWDYYELKK
jgi:hypothetical protein